MATRSLFFVLGRSLSSMACIEINIVRDMGWQDGEQSGTAAVGGNGHVPRWMGVGAPQSDFRKAAWGMPTRLVGSG